MSVAASLALALGMALAAADGVELRAGAVASERTRSTRVGDAGDTGSVLEAVPSAAVDVRGPDGELGATYAARLWTPELFARPELQVRHTVELRAAARPAPTWRLSLGANGQYGRQDLLSAPPAAGAVPAPVPTLGTVGTGNASATAAADVSLDARTRTGVQVTYSAGGGTDAESRRGFPVQRVFSASANVDWSATREDGLAARLDASEARTPAHAAVSRYAVLTASWRHRFSPALEGSAGAGLSVRTTELPGADTRSVEPSLELALTHDTARPVPISTRLALRASPYVDAITGTSSERATASGSTTWQLSAVWALEARAAASQLFGSDGIFTGTAALLAYRAIGAEVRLSVGATAWWQRSGPGGLAPAFTEYGSLVSATWTPRGF